LYHGDALAVLRTMPGESVDCCVTSPPYFALRDYGEPGQYGLESSPAEYVETMRAVFGEVRRVLADDGTLWLNIGDSYAGTGETGRNDAQEIGRDNLPQYGSFVQAERKARRLRVDYGLAPKNLLGIPWRLAFALQDDGWTLRSDVIWHKPNAMPESVTDRPSTTYEHVFLLAKQPRYRFNLDAIREPAGDYGGVTWGERKENGEPTRYGLGGMKSVGATVLAANPKGRNPGDVWTIPTQPFPDAHFAVMAPELARRCVVAGCKPGGVVLDPFCGSGTSGMVANQLGRRFVGIDLSAAYLDLALRTRLRQGALVEEVP
jgi:site-specific DNA-methyltransferase (cytosine-N4-specific)